jgi:sulfite reductase (ferredoxin)
MASIEPPISTRPSAQPSLSPEQLLEIRTFESETGRFQQGRLEELIFQPFRLLQGIYGQRQDDVQMVRIKIPLGRLEPNQVRAIADVAEEYSDGRMHVTTRQDFQIYWAKLDQVGDILRKLATVGLTTREACGNTVRNVTAAHDAGVSPLDVFDVNPWARAVSDHFLRHDLVQTLPRKFKIAFSGNDLDSAIGDIHDIGAIAVQRDDEYGFRIVVGGGLGRSPFLAKPFADFVPLNEILPLAHSIMRVFNRLGNRKNLMRARMKFLIEKQGLDKFRELVYEELAVVKADDSIVFNAPEGDPSLDAPDDWQPADTASLSPDPEFHAWYRDNVTHERRKGYYSALIRLTLGDIQADQARALADTVERFSDDVIVNTLTQNIVIRSVREDRLAAVFADLQAAGLAANGVHQIADVISCAGADTCRQGITASRGLGRVLGEHLTQYNQDADLQNIKVKISGCPNACGHHHIAPIGLHGVGKRTHGQAAPYYMLQLGGQADPTGTSLNIPITKISAKRVPKAIDRLIAFYREHSNEDETFSALIQRTEKKELRELLAPYAEIPTPDEAPEYYQDWGYTIPFSTKEVGAGECGTKDLPETVKRLAAAERAAFQAGVYLEVDDIANSLKKAEFARREAVYALLATTDEDVASDEDAEKKFQFQFVDSGVLPETFFTLQHNLLDFAGQTPNLKQAAAHSESTSQFVDDVQTYYQQAIKDVKEEKAA